MLGKKSHVDMKFLNVNVNMRFSHVNMREKSHVNMQHLFLTTVRSYSAQTRSQNEEKNPPPQTVPAPADELDIDDHTDPI